MFSYFTFNRINYSFAKEESFKKLTGSTNALKNLFVIHPLKCKSKMLEIGVHILMGSEVDVIDISKSASKLESCRKCSCNLQFST